MFIKKAKSWIKNVKGCIRQKDKKEVTILGTKSKIVPMKRTIPKSVLELIERLSPSKDFCEVLEVFPQENLSENQGDLLEEFKEFLISNSNGRDLPPNELLLNKFNLSDKKLRSLKKELYDIGFLDKINPRKYVITKN